MKTTMMDLLVFLVDPEIGQKFKEVSTISWSKEYADHLRRIIIFFDDISNTLAEAELHYRSTEEGQITVERLKEWENEYKAKLNT